jgi:acetyl-CoA carboxylase carboxyltransferase component
MRRLELLCDEGSLQIIRSEITSERMGEKARAGDGVVAGAGRIGGRPIFCFAQDSRFAGGSLGAAHADSIVRVQRLARKARVPVIGFVESGGARTQEGTAALNGYGRIFYEHVAMSGEVPQISVITGISAGGGSYSPALTDFVVMTSAAAMFLTGPAVVREVTGEDVTAASLGGSGVHERNGVCQFAVDSDIDAIFLVRQLLGYLPQSTHGAAERDRGRARRARSRRRGADRRPARVRRARGDGRDPRRRLDARGRAALGAQHRDRAGPPRRAPLRRRGQPAARDGRRDRRRGLAEGRAPTTTPPATSRPRRPRARATSTR